MSALKQGMGLPTTFEEHDRPLQPFVVAARTETLRHACEVLFVHGNDLTIDGVEGLFLSSSPSDPRFTEALDATMARASLAGWEALRVFSPVVQTLMAKALAIAGGLDSKVDEARRHVIAEVVAKSVPERMVASLIRDAKFDWFRGFVDWFPWLVTPRARELHRRFLSVTGCTDAVYERMLNGLLRLGSDVCEEVLRIAFTDGRLEPEISIAARGWRSDTAPVATDALRLFRLASDFAALKSGEDKALPLFIARYLNSHSPGPRLAFPCARYGARSESELDVVIPLLRLGMEVKLYQAAAIQTKNKIAAMANRLKEQLPAYKQAGCVKLLFVTNLPESSAQAVLKQSGFNPDMNEAVDVVCGLGELTKRFDSISRDLEEPLKSQWVGAAGLSHPTVADSRTTEKPGRTLDRSDGSRTGADSATADGSKRTPESPSTRNAGQRRPRRRSPGR